MAMLTSERNQEVAYRDELEALIEEAREHQRRRRRRGALALTVLIAAGTGAGVLASGGGGGGGGQHPPAAVSASHAAVSAFLASAERAVSGRFAATFAVAIPHRGRLERATVFAAQLSRGMTMYREEPAVGIYWAGSRAFEVFSGPRRDRHGIFTCTRPSASMRWRCTGPIRGIGMGGMFQLEGPYPPQALLLGLQNATVAYTGIPTDMPATQPQPVSLVRRRLAGRAVRCLQFGPLRHPLGSVCIDRDGMIAFYDLPPRVTYSMYRTATLTGYSTRVPRTAFTLPAAPRPRKP